MFIFLQSSLVAAAQEILPRTKGTAMSMASFNMFLGGAIGTSINAKIIGSYGVPKIFLTAPIILLIVGFTITISLRTKRAKNKVNN